MDADTAVKTLKELILRYDIHMPESHAIVLAAHIIHVLNAIKNRRR